MTYAIVAVIVTAFAAWAYFTAQRLNRLHIRTDSALLALQGALDRRAAVVAVVAPGVAAVAKQAESFPLGHGQFAQREAAERELEKAIASVESEAVSDAQARVSLAVRFYNEAVADTRALRLRPFVRLLRLGGTARLPEFYEGSAYSP